MTVPFDVAANGGSVAIDVGGRQIDVKVPAGIEDGKKLRVPADATGSADVILKVRIAPHPYFRREGNDIFLDVPISVAEAVLGGKVEVPTLGGERLEVKVRPGHVQRREAAAAREGDQRRRPVPRVQGGRAAGEVDDKSRELIEEFAKRNPQNPRANVPWA